jgi:hypothetical protein
MRITMAASLCLAAGMAFMAGCGGDDKQTEPATNSKAVYCVDEMVPRFDGGPGAQAFCYQCDNICGLIKALTQTAPQLLIIPVGTILNNPDEAENVPLVVPRGGIDSPFACKECPPDGMKGRLVKRRAGPGVPAMNLLFTL